MTRRELNLNLNLLKNSSHQANFRFVFATSLLGLNSFLLMYFGARDIDSNSFGLFLSCWAAFNTISLSLIGPFDMILPKNFLNLASSGFTEGQIFQLCMRIAFHFGVIAALIFSLYITFTVKIIDFSSFIFIALVLVNAAFQLIRIFYTAGGNSKKVLFISAMSSFVSFVIMIAAHELNSFNLEILLLSIISGYLSVIIFSKNNLRKRNDEAQIPLHFEYKIFLKQYVSIFIITLILLLFSNLTIILANLIEVDPKFLIVWVAISGLIRIPLTLLYATTGTMLNKISDIAFSKQMHRLKPIFIQYTKNFALISLVIGVLFTVLGSFAAKFFLGPEYFVPRYYFGIIALVESLISLVGLSRIFLIILHNDIFLIKILSISILIMLVTLIFPVSPEIKVALAPLLGSLFAFYFLSRKILNIAV